ncbi:unnamed protein product [Nezara viridula]|uniref:Uncharacterized protein n=1 Tax=Nezara viridula TaxID=85310 RepID=A0A9P0HPJ7_NEZVI|nr:unnamed protein product [Nezara viridula]
MMKKSQINDKMNKLTRDGGAIKDEHNATEIADLIYNRMVKDIKSRIKKILSMGIELGDVSNKTKLVKGRRGGDERKYRGHSRHRVKRHIIRHRCIRAKCPRCHTSWKLSNCVRKKLYREPLRRHRCGKKVLREETK